MTTELRAARVLHVEDGACQVCVGDALVEVGFAPMFPTPHAERVSPGHLVAVASRPGHQELVVWRWYDAVVVNLADDGTVALWEPAHGRVRAERRPMFEAVELGSRVFASAGLPGADWWAAGPARTVPAADDLDLVEVEAFYADNGLWDKVFA